MPLISSREVGGFPEETTHESLRPHGRAVERHRVLFPGSLPPRQIRSTLEGPPTVGQRHPLAPSHRSALARHAPAIRTLADCLRPLQSLAQGRNLGPNSRRPLDPTRRRRTHRPRSVVRGRNRHSGQPVCCRSGKKIPTANLSWVDPNAPNSMSHQTMRWVGRRGDLAPKFTSFAMAGVLCWQFFPPRANPTSPCHWVRCFCGLGVPVARDGHDGPRRRPVTRVTVTPASAPGCIVATSIRSSQRGRTSRRTRTSTSERIGSETSSSEWLAGSRSAEHWALAMTNWPLTTSHSGSSPTSIAC